MITMLRILVLVLLLHKSAGVIYHLNATEFERMPPIYKLDNYKSCLQEPSDVYCTVNFQLVSDEPNELLHMIEEYSEHSKTHFDHTKLRYGVCVTQNCQHYIQNNTSISETTLERCLNHSFWENYQLKTRILHYICYNSSDHEINIDTSDVVAGVIVFTILMLCVVGSLYDIYYTLTKRKGNPIILSFSLKRSCKVLFSLKRNETRSEHFKCLNALKCIISFGVIMVHCIFIYFVYGENIHDLELSYNNPFLQLLYNSSLMMQGIFVISGFLLAYKIELISEKHEIDWIFVPKAILKRYFRLTPAYAIVVLFMATWFKFQGPGPLWELVGKAEVLDCKKRWWMSLFFFNNYVYNYHCLPHTWSMATEMQLYCFGVILSVLFRKIGFRKVILTSLIIVGSVMVAIHTYLRDLNVAMFFAPSEVSQFFTIDPTFNGTYKMAHGNITGYAIGLSLGYFVYKSLRQKENKNYSKYKFIYSLVLPLILCVMLSGAIFYRDGPREPLYMRVLCASFTKPILGALMAAMIAGLVLKLENFYRKFLEWDLWVIPSKLTYCVYLVHVPYLLTHINHQPSLIHMNFVHLFSTATIITARCLVTAIPMFLFVEAPFTDLLNRVAVLPKKTIVDNSHKKFK